MKKRKLLKGAAFLGLLLILLLTYFRENFLLGINAIIAGEEYSRAYTYWLSSFFQEQSVSNLIKWKWGITMFFSLVISVITVISLHFWFKSVQLIKIVVIFYGIIFVIACLLALIGFLINSFNDIYFVLRRLLGFVQSPLPFFIFFVLFQWLKKNKTTNQPY